MTRAHGTAARACRPPREPTSRRPGPGFRPPGRQSRGLPCQPPGCGACCSAVLRQPVGHRGRPGSHGDGRSTETAQVSGWGLLDHGGCRTMSHRSRRGSSGTCRKTQGKRPRKGGELAPAGGAGGLCVGDAGQEAGAEAPGFGSDSKPAVYRRAVDQPRQQPGVGRTPLGRGGAPSLHLPGPGSRRPPRGSWGPGRRLWAQQARGLAPKPGDAGLARDLE